MVCCSDVWCEVLSYYRQSIMVFSAAAIVLLVLCTQFFCRHYGHRAGKARWATRCVSFMHVCPHQTTHQNYLYFIPRRHCIGCSAPDKPSNKLLHRLMDKKRSQSLQNSRSSECEHTELARPSPPMCGCWSRADLLPLSLVVSLDRLDQPECGEVRSHTHTHTPFHIAD